MKEKALEGLRVAILATNGVQEAELVEPRKALEEAGARTTLFAPQTGKIQASKCREKTSEFHADETFDGRVWLYDGESWLECTCATSVTFSCCS